MKKTVIVLGTLMVLGLVSCTKAESGVVEDTKTDTTEVVVSDAVVIVSDSIEVINDKKL